jgi:trehalose 6-phosphate phosphatase
MSEHENLPPLARVLEDHPRDVLLCTMAFDGVLAEYQRDPSEVSLPAARRHLLRRLAGAPGVALAIISGRRVADLESRAAVGPQVFYIGVHGMEITGPGFERIRRDLFEEYRDSLHRVAQALEPTVARIEGARLEVKEAALALHTHDIDPGDAVWVRFQLLNAAADLVKTNAVRAIRGRDVLELLPNLGQPRASAIDEVRRVVETRTARQVFGVYVGPDVVDDDAREGLPHPGLSIVVGRRGGGCYHFATLEDVDSFVGELIALRSGYEPVPSMV